jgi:hypothetical protein
VGKRDELYLVIAIETTVKVN